MTATQHARRIGLLIVAASGLLWWLTAHTDVFFADGFFVEVRFLPLFLRVAMKYPQHKSDEPGQFVTGVDSHRAPR